MTVPSPLYGENRNTSRPITTYMYSRPTIAFPRLAPNRGASVRLTTYEPVTSYTITGVKNGLKYRIKFQYDAYGDGWSGYRQ